MSKVSEITVYFCPQSCSISDNRGTFGMWVTYFACMGPGVILPLAGDAIRQTKKAVVFQDKLDWTATTINGDLRHFSRGKLLKCRRLKCIVVAG